ncbi:hypothetical protein SDC9_175545 [bioreactor metagenome]|uniref:Uncharacterized protein n=1 Tax=bioreactor metagenome TaxID=1076179 RepID=A0A645GPJ3_9ZZZZ
MVKEARPVKAMTTTVTGLTRLADTAACPKMMAPTIPMVDPSKPGMRKPASRMSSKANSISSNSPTEGNGTRSLAPAMAKIISVGKASG